MDETMDITGELMLDGNAAGGMFYELFGAEMTASPTECAHCGTPNEMGAMRVFNQAPGMIMCCPACQQIVLRIVQTPDAVYIDARGAAYLRIARVAS